MRKDKMSTSLTVETTTATKPTMVHPLPGIAAASSGSSSACASPLQKSCQAERIMAFRNGVSSGSGSNIGSGLGYIRRAASTDDGNIGSGQLFMNNSGAVDPATTNEGEGGTSAGNPWADIFRTSSKGGETETKQSRNESSQFVRLRSDRLDPVLTNNNNGGSFGDDDSMDGRILHPITHPQDRRPLGAPYNNYTHQGHQRSASADIFRTGNNVMNDVMNASQQQQNQLSYSPIIGTPTRSGMGGRKLPDWGAGSLRSSLQGGPGEGNDGGDNILDDTSWIPSIRPSLSCPTSVFESPLFPSSGSLSGSNNSLSAMSVGGPSSYLSGVGSGIGSNSGTRRLDHTLELGGGTQTLMLSQPYRLEKIASASAEPSPTHADASEDHGLLGELHHDSEDEGDSMSDPISDPDRDDEDGLMADVDVSVIECDDEDFFRHNISLEEGNNNNHASAPSSSSKNQTAANMANHQGGPMLDVDGNPMRNLSDAFELLVMKNRGAGGGVGGASQLHGVEQHQLDGATAPQSSSSRSRCDSNTINSLADMSKSGDTSSTKPSPTSVLGFESESGTTASSAAADVSTIQLENGLTVASISMPHFHLHDSLAGNLCQGIIDRVSFYSVVRDINKEALDAALTDPKGGLYNDGTVHGKKKQQKQSSKQKKGGEKDASEFGAGSDEGAGKLSTATPLPPAATSGSNNNGKKTQVVGEDGRVHVHPNPREERKSVLVMACMSGEQNPNEPLLADVVAASAASPSLGAALLDEEWYLMSAIASRSPDEVAMNQSTKLLPTFYEAMGEKDGSTAESNTGASSRTQLWKPGRSWWEAKSGKNPWVEPVVHNNRWRYLWPLIHYHKFIAKCIKKLKRNGIDVKNSTSNVSLFLRQEVCNVSDHLAFMSKYDSEEWTSALSHFDGWTDHDPNVEETLRSLVASQQLAGVAETADVQSTLLRSQIDDKILKAMQAAKDEAGRDAYEYKDVPAQQLTKKDESTAGGGGGANSSSSSSHQPYSAQDSLPNRSAGWTDESHLRSAIDSKKRTINDTSWSNRSGYHPHHPPPYPHQYPPHHHHHPPYGPGYGPGHDMSMNSSYYPPHPHHHYDGYGQYPPHHSHHHPPHHHHMGYHHHGDLHYNDQYGHHHQYYNGYGHYPSDGSFHESMVFDTSVHQDPYMHPAHTPSRYQGGDMHHHGQYPPASPYWGHLNISQLPGIAASPSIHVTPSKPPRGSHPNRSYRKRQQHQYQGQHHHQYGGKAGSNIDGKAKSLIMFPNQTNSPASRFVMSPQDKSNPYYTTKNSQTAAGANGGSPSETNKVNQSTGPEESFVLPTIEDFNSSPESPADKAAGHTSLSMDLMPPCVNKMYTSSRRQKGKMSEVSEN